MSESAELPIEFAALAGRVNYVQKVSDNEYHSSCPNCGGEPHYGGAWPDRFVMWVSSRSGTPFGMCIRKCGWRWSPGKQDAEWTPEERAEMERKRAEVEAAREARIKLVSSSVMEQKFFEKYHDQMQADALKYWTQIRGITPDWVDWLKLGAIEDYQVRGRLSTYHSPAYTIPVWTYGAQAENIKVRVAEPKDENDRYRNLYKSGAQHLYAPRYDLEQMGNKNIVVEGEIKAAITQIHGGIDDEIQIQGWQSKSPEARIIRMYDNSELIYLALDPDAYYPDAAGNVTANRVARQIGIARVRYVIPPINAKFDDAILAGYNFRNAVNMAIKPQSWKYWSATK